MKIVKEYKGCGKSAAFIIDGIVEILAGIFVLIYRKNVPIFLALLLNKVDIRLSDINLQKISASIVVFIPLVVLFLGICIIVSGILKLVGGIRLTSSRIVLYETYIEAEYYKNTFLGLSRRLFSARYQDIEDVSSKSYAIIFKFGKKKYKIWAADKYVAARIVSMVKSTKMGEQGV